MLVILWPMLYGKDNKIYAIYFHVKKYLLCPNQTADKEVTSVKHTVASSSQTVTHMLKKTRPMPLFSHKKNLPCPNQGAE